MEITAVDWLEMEFIKLEKTIGVNHKMYELIEQAKEMEKQQIIDFANSLLDKNINWTASTITAEQYYNKTFKKLC